SALAIPITDALGWLVAVGGGAGGDGVGSSVRWLGRVAVEAVRLVARGAVVPTLHTKRRSEGKVLDLSVRWLPALVSDEYLGLLTAGVPGPVTALAGTDS